MLIDEQVKKTIMGALERHAMALARSPEPPERMASGVFMSGGAVPATDGESQSTMHAYVIVLVGPSPEDLERLADRVYDAADEE